MLLRTSFLPVCLVAVVQSQGASAQPGGPVVDMPSDSPTSIAVPDASADPLLRGLQEERFERAQNTSTSIGGYGELHYNYVKVEGEPREAEIDLHRLVLFLAHNFSANLRSYAEIEVEHALAAEGRPGEVGIEQAFIDYRLLDERLVLRAGVILVPLGIINQWHEPPIFNGVERPRVDRVILPTTWREGGIGITGAPVEGLRYELYLMSGLDPSGFSAGSGLRGGRQAVAEAQANAWAFAGRLEWEPMLGVIAGISGYASPWTGKNGDLSLETGVDGEGNPITEPLELDVPVLGGAADARLKKWGVEARGVVSFFSVGDTAELRGTTAEVDMGSQLLGGYVELGYDVLYTTELGQELVPFARYEYYDTAFATADGSGAGDRAATDYVVGVSYRPIPQVVFKSDVILRRPNEGPNATIFNAGLGWMF